MTLNYSKKNNFSELRKRAEEELMGKEIKSKKNSLESSDREVKLHEIELKMQNEELLSIQAKLQQSIENYAELFDLAPIGYFILDHSGIITNVNNKGSRLLGIDNKQLIGNPFSVFLNGESLQDDYYRHRNLVIGSNELKQLESEIKKKDGTTCPVLIESVCVKDKEGKFKEILLTLRDISIQKEHEYKVEQAFSKEKELSEMKSNFISMTSHEFRTPLSTILSSISLIENYNKTEDNDKRKKHVNKIKSSVDGLKEILTEFFSFSQIEKNLLHNNPETFNLVRLAEETISLINSKDYKVIYNHIGEFQDVYLDAKLLKVCLINILSNAIKYSPKGGTIEMATKKDRNGNIEISVKDYGIGIPENEKAHVFGQFFKAKNADVAKGTGMGLNIIQKLITMMGGTILFESKINEGTIFILKFPSQKII